eukprot:CAMPEP_0172591114 /NCGR_PEP_ID=MMETSP1068-20121228/9768_1 /TAXON_ID=35684 /ORGANISM="Pseudopedinella elastica, Strain CCMP716" /LENGTH=419 /DNA_ID=CAMNT_0013387337 /DNA_START=323 /DNA_END=1583 /DNA_ORIENTATION=-
MSTSHEGWASFCERALMREASLGPQRLREFISNTFWRVDVNELKYEDIERWLLFFLTCREVWDDPYTPGETAMARRLISDIESALRVVFSHETPGYSPAPFIRINHPIGNHSPPDPIFEPIFGSLFCSTVRSGVDAAFRACGFSRSVDKLTGVVLWKYQGTQVAGDSSDKKVLLFLPGFGFGAVLYFPFILLLVRHRVLSLEHCALLVAEPPGISGHPLRPENGLLPPYPSAIEFVDAIERAMHTTGAKSIDAIGHSYGTVLMAYISNIRPSILNRTAYLEPVCFFTNNSAFWPMIYAPMNAEMLWRRIKKGGLSFGPRFAVMWALFGGEAHQYVIHNAIWFSEIAIENAISEKNSLVVLTEKDNLISSAQLASYFSTFHPNVPQLILAGIHGTSITPGNLCMECIGRLREHFAAGVSK